jgi:Spy/CpxP family protein refolding chaperone
MGRRVPSDPFRGKEHYIMNSTSHCRGRGAGRRFRRTAAAAFVAALLAGVAAPGFAQDATPDHGGGRHHGWRMDPEARADRMQHMVRRMFSSVNASEDQKARADAIVKQALADLQPLSQKRREGHKAAIDLLSKPSIDRGAVEAQRQQQVRLADATSKRMTQAFVDLAEVLTPEQRAALAQRMGKHFQG